MTAWNTWKVHDELTGALIALSCAPSEKAIDEVMERVERFVVLLYDRTSLFDNTNACRKDLFTRKGRALEALPPTSAGLLEHIKRAAYQGGHCWGQALIPAPTLPSPGNWGWQKNATQMWEPYWTSLPEASKACQQLIRCGCDPEKGCASHCKCVRNELKCTALCKCGGNCDRASR